MKKFVFITDQFKTGGVESVFMSLALSLDYDFVLIPVHNKFDEDLTHRLPKNVSILKMELDIGRNVFGFFKLFASSVRCRQKLTKSSQEYVVINFSDTLSSLLLASMLNKKYYSWLHCSPMELDNGKSKFVYSLLLKRSRGIVFVCGTQRDFFYSLPQYFRLRRVPNYVCTNYVNIESINTLKQTNPRITYKFILMVSRLDMRSKDFETLIDGYAMLDDQIKYDYKLVLVGDGPDRLRVERFIEDKNLRDNIILLGRKANPYMYMSRASVYVHASKMEGYALALVEALACGCSVVASDCHVGPREILDNGKYGYLFETGNAAELAASIKKALITPIPKEVAYERALFLTEKGKREAREFFENA